MEISDIASLGSEHSIQADTKKAPSEADLNKATREFEAILLRQFLGQALKPILHESLGSQAPGAHIYQHMMTDAIAGQLAAEETFGMSSLLQMQLAATSAGSSGEDAD